MITNPRIAVLALNPSNNGEESCGPEEASIIIPAIDQLAEQKIQAFGPYPTDEFFGNGHFVEFDGIMAMYHDQATTPFHSLYTEDGVLFTAGLPLVHTAANTTPSYSITGCNEADAISFRHAIYLALDAFCNREDYDEAYENPLPKLYHEKRDESEKVRFSIPEKKRNKERFGREDDAKKANLPCNQTSRTLKLKKNADNSEKMSNFGS